MQNNTDISKRITQMLDYLCIKINNFAKKLGYDRSQMLYDIINRKSKPSYDFFERFLNSEFSELISVEWLITGKGSMTVESKPVIYSSISKTNEPLKQYNKEKCSICEYKDKIIEQQSITINTLEKLVLSLEERNESLKKLCDTPEECHKKDKQVG